MKAMTYAGIGRLLAVLGRSPLSYPARGWRVHIARTDAGALRPRAPDQKPEDDRQLEGREDGGDAADGLRVLRKDERGERARDVARARDQEEDAEDARDETRADH